jgi:hypothetical protein
MKSMRNHFRYLFFWGAVPFLAATLLAQSRTGSIDFTARITPTASHPEPVRQFTFYILTKSYADITKEIASQDVLPTEAEFIDKWNCSPELKAWMKKHDTMDLNSPDVDKLISPDDIMKVPEFFSAYQRSNSGGVTKGLPQPKFRASDQQANPERYKKQHEEWLAATQKFIETNTYTIQGIELELTAVSPKPAWDKLHNDQRRKVAQLAPDTAQMKYLATKVDTDLDGHAVVAGLPPGTYWISSLGLEAASGDQRLVWDVATKVDPGRTTRVELTNLNGSSAHASANQ